MNLRLITAALILLNLPHLDAGTDGILRTDADLKRLAFEQKLGVRLPLDLSFQDETGRPVTLRQCLADQPAILILGYYACPMLCNLVLNGVVETLQEIKPAADTGEELIFISIDPREGPELARSKKATYLKRFGRAGAERRWHFLSGAEGEIKQIAEEVGFHYQYDPAHSQFAHPSGLVILTPDGTISRYFFGVSYAANDLRQALQDAKLRKTASPIEALVILCSRFLPLTGKYSPTVMGAVRVLAVATVLLLVCFVAWNHWRTPTQNDSKRSSAS